jgi:hypothetical protein
VPQDREVQCLRTGKHRVSRKGSTEPQDRKAQSRTGKHRVSGQGSTEQDREAQSLRTGKHRVSGQGSTESQDREAQSLRTGKHRVSGQGSTEPMGRGLPVGTWEILVAVHVISSVDSHGQVWCLQSHSRTNHAYIFDILETTWLPIGFAGDLTATNGLRETR